MPNQVDMGQPMVIWIDYNPLAIEPHDRRHDFIYTHIPKRLGLEMFVPLRLHLQADRPPRGRVL